MDEALTPETPAPPAPASSPPKFRVQFYDGPAAGIQIEFDKEQTLVRYGGMWDYEPLGRREGDYWLFTVRPKSRPIRRAITMLKVMNGQDPRLIIKAVPNKVIKRGRNDLCWCGSGRKFKKCHASAQSN